MKKEDFFRYFGTCLLRRVVKGMEPCDTCDLVPAPYNICAIYVSMKKAWRKGFPTMERTSSKTNSTHVYGAEKSIQLGSYLQRVINMTEPLKVIFNYVVTTQAYHNYEKDQSSCKE